MLLGATLRFMQEWEEGLRYLDQARTMLKAAENTPNLSEAYHIISWMHYDQGRLPEALDAVEEAWKHAELTDNPFIQASISLSLGKTLFSANRDTEAWKYIETALMKDSYIGDRFAVAQALEYMGYGYLHRGDYQNAYGAYEATAEKYAGTVCANTSGGKCKDNMARIKQKQENTGITIGFHGHSLDFDDTFFYPPVQASASVSSS